MTLLLALLVLQEPEPRNPPARKSLDPAEAFSVSLLATYFQVQEPSLSDDFGATLLGQAPLGKETFLEVGARRLPGQAGGSDYDLGLYTLGLSTIAQNHGFRFLFAGGAALAASGDLEDDVDFGVYAAFQCDSFAPLDPVRITFRYEVLVPETDSAIGGRELELIQGISLGLAVLF